MLKFLHGGKMIVYIEYVLIDNFIIDYLMLKATFNLTGMPVKKRRLFLCAFLGAIVALTYPLMQDLGVLSTILKVCTGLLIVLIANQYASFKSFYINSIIFFLHTFLTGGIILGLSSLLNIELSTEMSSAFMVVPVYLILRGLGEVVKYFFARKSVQNFIYKTRLTMFDKSIMVRGFLDTGNLTFIENTPVIFISSSMALSVIDIAKMKNLKKISISTVSGEREHYAFRLDEFKVFYHGKQNIYNSVWACIVQGEQFIDYDIIFGSAFIKGDSYESIAK